MPEVLLAAAERGIGYLEGLHGRGVPLSPQSLPVLPRLISCSLLIRHLRTRSWLCSIPIRRFQGVCCSLR